MDCRVTPSQFSFGRLNVLGVGVSALNLQLATAAIEDWIGAGQREYVCVTGVHGIIESRRDPAVRAIHNAAGLVVPDGMPLVWLARRRGLKMLEPAHHSDSTKRDLRAGSASAMEKRRMAARFSSFGAGDNGRDGHGG